MVLASFSGRDDTGGNSLSTTDNDRTELYMKDAIDVSSLVQITCTPKRGGCALHRLLPLDNWNQYP